MTDHTLARADEVLTELVELVETARTLPMSSSCVIPRERTLDLLDALREVLPPEMIEARRLVAQRDQVLAEATTRAERMIATADDEAERRRAEANATAEQLVAEAEQRVVEARIEAHQTVEAARAEQERLTSAATVQQAAVAAAERTRAESEQQAEHTRKQAGRYADKLTADAQGYAAQTLSGLVDTLQRLLATAENGRDALSGSPATDPVAGPVELAEDAESETAEPVTGTDEPPR